MQNWIKSGLNKPDQSSEVLSSEDTTRKSPPKSRVHLLKRVFPSKKKPEPATDFDSEDSHGSQREDCSLQ